MINTLPTNSFQNIDDKTAKRTAGYWLRQKNTNTNNNSNEKSNNQLTEDVLDINSAENSKKTKNITKVGLSVASAVILTGAGIFFFLKGGPQFVQKGFKNLHKKLEHNVLLSKIQNIGNFSGLDCANIYMLKTLEKFSKKLDAINNFTTLKDVSFKKGVSYLPFGAKIHAGITKLFEKIGYNSLKQSYKNTSEVVHSLKFIPDVKLTNKATDEIVTIGGRSMTKAQVCEEIKRLNEDLLGTYNKDFDGKALESRYANFKEKIEALKKKFDSILKFKTKEFFSEFMAEKPLEKPKTILQNNINTSRNKISYSCKDMVSAIDDKIMKVTSDLSYKDVEKLQKLKNIYNNIKEYSKGMNSTQTLKEKILSDIESLALSFKQNNGNSRSVEAIKNEKIANDILEIKDVFNSYKPGKVQDILELYEKVLSKSEYKEVEKIYNEAIKKLDKSIKLETEDFYSKLRDLAMGSAPTDILTIGGSLAVLGYNIGKTDDVDERVSISLKSGIPVLAGIGSVLYCNAKLFAGTKSLIFGTISTFIVNKLGVAVDDMLKKQKNEKLKAQTQNN